MFQGDRAGRSLPTTMLTSTETVLVSEVIPASRHAIYAAWLDTRQHSAFTGDTAVIEPAIGGRHSTFGGYASGTMLELEPHRRIVQSWRSTEFPEGSPDSRLEVTLEDTAGGTLVTILHTQIPEGQGDRYKDGWIQYYLEPLKRYFSKRVSNGVNGHRYGHAYAKKEDHVGDNERENEEDLEMQGDTNDQNDDLDEDDDKDTAAADLEDDDTVLASGDQDDLDEDSDDLTAAKGDDDDDDADEGGDDDTVEVGADAIQEVSTDDARRVVVRPLEDDVRSPVVVEDMTGRYGKPARAKPKAKPVRAKAKAAARKPPGQKAAKKTAAKKSAKSAKAAKPAKSAKGAKSAKAAKPAAKVMARAGKAAKGKKAAPKKAAAKRPKAKAKAGPKAKPGKRR
jgi:uncharacterized protein YndB with AHSA1/START domain